MGQIIAAGRRYVIALQKQNQFTGEKNMPGKRQIPNITLLSKYYDLHCNLDLINAQKIFQRLYQNEVQNYN